MNYVLFNNKLFCLLEDFDYPFINEIKEEFVYNLWEQRSTLINLK